MSTVPLHPWPTTRNPAALGSRNRQREQCSVCGLWVASNALTRHVRWHLRHGEQALAAAASVGRMPAGHHRCKVAGCDRIVATYADRCWRHEHKTDAARFAELDAAIAMREGRE